MSKGIFHLVTCLYSRFQFLFGKVVKVQGSRTSNLKRGFNVDRLLQFVAYQQYLVTTTCKNFDQVSKLVTRFF